MKKSRVEVLIPGYAKEIEGGWIASSTVSLIVSNGKKIIVDPGTNREGLLRELKSRGISIDDVDYVYMTHCHTDHNLLAGIFEKTVILDAELQYEGDKQVAHGNVIPGTDITILPTPGHDPVHSSLLVETEQGKVIVAGDVFWWKAGDEQKVDRESLLSLEDPFVTDEKALQESRETVLKIADWIIPGHGKMLRVVQGH